MSIYKKISNKFDERYESKSFEGIENYLKDQKSYRVLEIGVGTGNWAKCFPNSEFYGIDLSIEMLQKAKNKTNLLVNANAEMLPIKENSFEFIYFLNVLHQISNKQKAIENIFSALKENGKVSIIFNDFHDKDNNWFTYDFFPNTKEIDKIRFFPPLDLIKIFNQAGFSQIEIKNVDIVKTKWIGNNVFKDVFLKKHNSSQLAMLSDEEYNSGIRKIKKTIEENPSFEFKTNLIFKVLEAVKS